MDEFKKYFYYAIVALLIGYPGYLFYKKAIYIPDTIYLAEQQMCFLAPEEFNPADLTELRFIGMSTYVDHGIVLESLSGFDLYREQYRRWIFNNFTQKPLFTYPGIDSEEFMITRNDFIRNYKYRITDCERIGVKFGE